MSYSYLDEVDKEFLPELGLQTVGDPITLTKKLELAGYECLPYLAFQIALILNTRTEDSKIRALLLEGPSGCGKSFLAKSLAKITQAELLVLSCYNGMETRNLIEAPSSFALASAMAGHGTPSPDSLMNLGILSRAYLTSQKKPVILGPIQDGIIWLESRPPIEADGDNLLLIFTKNFNRRLDDALLRRVHPITMTYLDSTLERKILSAHCNPTLIENLVRVADIMRYSGGSYQFDRPPAPEELLTTGKYITLLLDWGVTDFGFVGAAVWNIISKSEHDRAVLEHMLRYHPDFMDPLVPDNKGAPTEVIQARFGRVLLKNIVSDPRESEREKAWENL
jgi:energy-coupling factor transporter ATP-binding protein EcfA2